MSDTSLPRLTRDAQRLLMLVQALTLSGSRLEDLHWENLLDALLNKLLLGRKNKTVESVLDYMLAGELEGYEILFEHAETCSESALIQQDGQDYDALLISAPIVAWTRYRLPDGLLDAKQQQQLAAGLQSNVLAEGAKLALIPQLVNFDQMPQSFHETRLWTQRLALQALGGTAEPTIVGEPPHEDGMLADARFIVGVVVVPKGAPLFRWQAEQSKPLPTRTDSLNLWSQIATTTLATMFTGCQSEYLLPDAFYNNNREADRRIRPMALKAAVTWLQTAANLPPDELRAVIVGCGETTTQEYRVGFSTRHNNHVVYGCIWPVLSKEEALPEMMDSDHIAVPDEITALLKELGLSEVRRLPGLYPAEFCDDCGAPSFPNAAGEMEHPELPDETVMDPVQFH
ncbi:MAG: DUF2863 family protein [Burkholderiaceae bacterium]|nr:DUF2863 family protein [Burkholderiaceae bacterium]